MPPSRPVKVEAVFDPARLHQIPTPALIESQRAPKAARCLKASLEDRGDALAAADAERDETVASLAPFKLVHQLHGEDGAGRPHRMPQGNGAAVGVDLLYIDLKPRCRLRPPMRTPR